MRMTIHIERQGDVAHVVFARPEARNALSVEMVGQLIEVTAEMAQDVKARAVLFSGEGAGFCAGADLKERATMEKDAVKRHVTLIRQAIRAIEQLPMPTIALLHGFAFGGGLELALACDLRFAARDTLVGLTETALAILPGAGGTQRLARLIGPMHAKRLIFSAARIDATEALQIGLLTDVADTKEEAFARAGELTQQIAGNGPLAVRQAKWAIDQGLSVDLAKGLELEWEAYQSLIPTSDRVEALHAFREKRKPQFEGR
ncbi:enoyl-CoA hydratase-related protein [Ferroacidibacillus organovorans]|uniref:Enoyl-CoA hydratase n=2 Tax=Ferroacidibacillus organovorans TaxID=1765683 RepID=A0A1V4EWD2_9BACL|nr:enoyl-CoA hydratase-related protein [Ferroacidibacillus organovorans]OPG17236.1 enoyl-CoA hydratase [Ferroacidibacillus organovorans]